MLTTERVNVLRLSITALMCSFIFIEPPVYFVLGVLEIYKINLVNAGMFHSQGVQKHSSSEL